MRTRQSLTACGQILVFFFSLHFSSANAFAATEKVVYSFLGTPDGANPKSGVVADAAGNLYGTTVTGGEYLQGTLFELSPPAAAGDLWTETVLYSFRGGGLPYGALIFDKRGNLYGTLQGGGDPNYNPGSIFELSPPLVPGSACTESLLWTFPLGGREGFQPFGKLVMDDDGNLYGTTQLGGGNQCGCGVVFELVSPKESGGLWAERILHNFGAVAHDGVSPGPDLLLRGGVLYGTTQGSGASGSGGRNLFSVGTQARPVD